MFNRLKNVDCNLNLLYGKMSSFACLVWDLFIRLGLGFVRLYIEFAEFFVCWICGICSSVEFMEIIRLLNLWKLFII